MTQSPGGAAQAAPPPDATVSATAADDRRVRGLGGLALGGAPEPDRISENVPLLLNRLQLLVVAGCVVFALLAALLQFLTWQAGDRAANHTEQLTRIQDVQSTLYRADALATNAFLHDGLEPDAQRAQYDEAIDRVNEQLTSAAQAQPADREALTALNDQVSAYTNAITEARVNNRQGFPVGSEYLLDASKTLRTGAEPIFAALVESNTERADDDMRSAHPWLLLLLALLVLAGLWWVNREVARRFRRRINRGLLWSGVIVAVIGFFTVAYAASVAVSNGDLRDEEFADAAAFAEARTAANDAKSNESLRLIRRGSGAEHEEAWQEAAGTVQDALGDERSLLGSWESYADGHARVVDLDETGKWVQAVQLATSARGPTRAFDEFDREMQAAVESAGTAVTDRLGSNEVGLLLALLTLVGGLVAAGTASWGIGLRRKEYA